LAPAGSKAGEAEMPALAARFAVPDLAAFMAVVTLLYCLFIFDGGRKLFRDSDTGWHIRTGETILATHALPRVDPYSFTRAGAAWLDWEWGADVLFGLAHRFDGLRGVATLAALTVSACSYLWFKLHWIAGGDFFIACAMAPPMLTTASLHWLGRPHIFSWLLLLGALMWAERARRNARPFQWRDAAVVAMGTALWANLHASFFLVPVIALIFMTARPRFFAWALVASVLGSFANPYGWQLHAHVFSYLTNNELLDRVAEFQSFNFHTPGSAQIMVVLGLAAAGGTLALTQGKTAHFLLAAVFCAVALRSARGLPLVALAVLPFANASLLTALRGVRRLRATLDYSGRLRVIDRKLHGFAFAAVAILACLVAFRAPALASKIGFPPEDFPVAAAAAIDKLPLDARILAPDKFGGYIIYRWSGARKIFFDGRSDFYGAGFMKQYIELMEARPGWREILAPYHCTHALLTRRSSLGAALEDSGWRVLYQDDVARLLEAPKTEAR
jgi:hypothetical protein